MAEDKKEADGKAEGGKKVTIKPWGREVVITVWRKNGGVLLPLVLNRMEAQRVVAQLQSAIAAAAKEPS